MGSNISSCVSFITHSQLWMPAYILSCVEVKRN